MTTQSKNKLTTIFNLIRFFFSATSIYVAMNTGGLGIYDWPSGNFNRWILPPGNGVSPISVNVDVSTGNIYGLNHSPKSLFFKLKMILTKIFFKNFQFYKIRRANYQFSIHQAISFMKSIRNLTQEQCLVLKTFYTFQIQ